MRTIIPGSEDGRKSKCGIDDAGRECSVCGEYKFWSEYNKYRLGTRGFTSACRDCLHKHIQSSNGHHSIYKIDDVGRVCTKCGEHKPWKMFSPAKLGTNGRVSQCLDCICLRINPGKTPPFRCKIDDEGRECARCHKYKKWDDFYKDSSYQTKHSSTCKDCLQKQPGFRLNSTISSAMLISLKSRGGSKKRKHWEDLVGFTLEELKHHLESLFEKNLKPGPDMFWENFGREGWEVDHIKPIASFEFKKAADKGFQDCWALENLMPRWKTTAIARAHGSSQIGNVEKRDKMMFVNTGGFRLEGMLEKKRISKRGKKVVQVEKRGFFDLEKMTSSL